VHDFGIKYWFELDLHEKKLKAEETGVLEETKYPYMPTMNY
jgi:hypothetical protein